MIRFYRLSYRDLEELPVDVFEDLWLSIDVLEAQERIQENETAVFPDLKKSAMNAKNKALSRRAYPTSVYPVRSVDAKELSQKLQGK